MQPSQNKLPQVSTQPIAWNLCNSDGQDYQFIRLEESDSDQL